MQTLPAETSPDETVNPWNVREALLDTGREAARQLGRWDDALELNAAATASKRDRGAPATDIARGRFNDYGPLIRLGRTGEALDLLLECRQAFEHAHDIQMLGNDAQRPWPTSRTSEGTARPRSPWNATPCATATWPGT